VPEEGLFFRQDWIRLAPTYPSYVNRRFFIAWDFAISEKQRADYTVGVCLLQDEHDNLYLVDLVRFKGDMERICHEFISMIQRWSQFEGRRWADLEVSEGEFASQNAGRTHLRVDRDYAGAD
jgi:phage terminase large subunit-like protein